MKARRTQSPLRTWFQGLACPATTPKRQNVSFFPTAAAAQQRGFRACKRCRPDASPGSPEWNARADVVASVVVPPSGLFAWSLFLGPMEYDHLTRVGHDFDDVNPYGWPGFRTVIRPFAVGIRSFFV